MLPQGAFQRRAGGGMRLHGGDSWYYTDEELYGPGYWSGGGDAGATWVSTPEPAPAPAPAPAPSYDPGPAPAPAPAPVYYAPAPAPAPAAPNWTQTVNDIYIQELGRNADQSGMGTFTNLLNQGYTGEQIRNIIRGSQEYQQNNPGAAPAPAAPAAPTPATFTPYNLDQYGYTTDQEMAYYNAAKLANWHMSRGDPNGYAQQFINQANELKAHLDQPFRIDTISSGGGDAGSACIGHRGIGAGQHAISSAGARG